MNLKAHLKVECHPNKMVRTFHVNRIVSECSHFGFGDSMLGLTADNKKPGKLAATIAEMLKDVVGVTGGSMDKHSISVKISDAFSWDEVTPAITGKLVLAVFPEETDGGSVLISCQLLNSYRVQASAWDEWDDGMRYDPVLTADREEVSIEMDIYNPSLDINALCSSERTPSSSAPSTKIDDSSIEDFGGRPILSDDNNSE